VAVLAMLREINNLSLSILATFEGIILKMVNTAKMALYPSLLAFLGHLPKFACDSGMAGTG